MTNDERQWHAAVGAHVARGMTERDAVRMVVREQPELHQAYLRAFNEQRGGSTSPPARPGGFGGGDPILAWNTAVASYLAQGLTQRAAIRAVVKEQPGLHQAYLAQYNSEVKAGRTPGRNQAQVTSTPKVTEDPLPRVYAVNVGGWR